MEEQQEVGSGGRTRSKELGRKGDEGEAKEGLFWPGKDGLQAGVDRAALKDRDGVTAGERMGRRRWAGGTSVMWVQGPRDGGRGGAGQQVRRERVEEGRQHRCAGPQLGRAGWRVHHGLGLRRKAADSPEGTVSRAGLEGTSLAPGVCFLGSLFGFPPPPGLLPGRNLSSLPPVWPPWGRAGRELG